MADLTRAAFLVDSVFLRCSRQPARTRATYTWHQLHPGHLNMAPVRPWRCFRCHLNLTLFSSPASGKVSPLVGTPRYGWAVSPLLGTSAVRIGATFSWHFRLPRAAEIGSPLVGPACHGWAALWCHLKLTLPRCHLNMAPSLCSWCHLKVALYTAFAVSPLVGTFLPSYLPNQGHL